MAKHPVVSDCKVSRGLLGAWKLTFPCPSCRAELTSKEAAIGKLDDCPECGTQFHVSQRIGEQIAELEAEANAAAEAARQEAEARRNQEEEARRRQKRETQLIREKEVRLARAARAEEDDRRGYDYPNLRKYQSSLETTALIGAILFCTLGFLVMIGGVMTTLSAIRLSGATSAIIVAAPALFSVLVCLAAAAAWYFWWMVVAELIRLTITLALDVRTLRDNALRDPASE